MKTTTIYRGAPSRANVPRIVQLGVDAGIARTRRDAFLAAARTSDAGGRAWRVQLARDEHRLFMLMMRHIRERLARGEAA
jgi:hypothetical protein